MKRRVLAVLLSVIFLPFVSGCDDTATVNISNDNETVSKEIGTNTLVQIGKNIYYDPMTKIVYFWNGVASGQYSTMPSPYYAPNGLPYKYNVETNTFEEIKEGIGYEY